MFGRFSQFTNVYWPNHFCQFTNINLPNSVSLLMYIDRILSVYQYIYWPNIWPVYQYVWPISASLPMYVGRIQSVYQNIYYWSNSVCLPICIGWIRSVNTNMLGWNRSVYQYVLYILVNCLPKQLTCPRIWSIHVIQYRSRLANFVYRDHRNQLESCFYTVQLVSSLRKAWMGPIYSENWVLVQSLTSKDLTGMHNN